MPMAAVSALWLRRPVNTQTSLSSWPNFKCTYKKCENRDAVEEGQAFDSHCASGRRSFSLFGVTEFGLLKPEVEQKRKVRLLEIEPLPKTYNNPV